MVDSQSRNLAVPDEIAHAFMDEFEGRPIPFDCREVVDVEETSIVDRSAAGAPIAQAVVLCCYESIQRPSAAIRSVGPSPLVQRSLGVALTIDGKPLLEIDESTESSSRSSTVA